MIGLAVGSITIAALCARRCLTDAVRDLSLYFDAVLLRLRLRDTMLRSEGLAAEGKKHLGGGSPVILHDHKYEYLLSKGTRLQ